MLLRKVFHCADVEDAQPRFGHSRRGDNVLAGFKRGGDTEGVSRTIEYFQDLFAPVCVRPIALHPSGFQDIETSAGLSFREDKLITPEE
jgi:hypothetical protein